ncbi:hypothetical protein EBR96_02600, partial [bacterium]|nr:hypothetical protein [bacterium]
MKDLSDILDKFSFAGKQGQSRLPADWVENAAKDVLAVELGRPVPAMADDVLIRLMIDQMRGNPNMRTDPESLAKSPVSRFVLDFFRIEAIVNQSRPNMWGQIIANYTKPSQWVAMLFLELRAGVIEMQDGRVTVSRGHRMELSESAEQVRQYEQTVLAIHTIPAVRDANLAKGSVNTFMAASDSNLEGGGVEGRAAIALHREQAARLRLLYDFDWSSHPDLQSPYGIFDPRLEIKAAWKKVLDGTMDPKSIQSTSEKPYLKPELLCQIGMGSDPTRGEAIGDTPWSHGNLAFTNQPGRHDWESATPLSAMRDMIRAIHWGNVTLPSQKENAEWLMEFAKPGGVAYRQFTAKDGAFNRFIVNLPLADAVVNYQKYGSRGADEIKDVKSMHFIGDNRAITVARFL